MTRLVQGGDGAGRLRAAGAWSRPGYPVEDKGPSPLRTGRCWAPTVSLVNRGARWRDGQLAGWTLQPLSPLVLSPDSISAPASPQPRLLAPKQPAWIPERVSGNRPQGGLGGRALLLSDWWACCRPEGSPTAAVPPLALAWAAGRCRTPRSTWSTHPGLVPPWPPC